MATKPRRRARLSAEELAQEDFNREFEAVFEALAAEQGKPPGASPVSEAKKLALWGQTDPHADYDALVEMLQTSGVPPEVAATLTLLQEHADNEELMAAFAQPTQDPDLADVLARMATHPFRTGFLLDIADPDDRVKEAERMDARWAKATGDPLDMAPTEVAPAQQAAPSGVGATRDAGYSAPGSVDVPAPLPGTEPQPAMSVLGG